jgi:hypothetical protein
METIMLKRFFAVALLLSVIAFTPSLSKAAAPAVANPAAAAPAPPEQHPHIRAALRELREAKHELETAAHDFGGHRKEAIESIDNSIRQLEEALKYDKK